MLTEQTVKKLHSKREKERDPERENERSPLHYRWLGWTASIEFLFLVLTLNISRQKLFTGNGQPHFFFLFYFHSLAWLWAWHTAVCSCCFQIRAEVPLYSLCHSNQIIRTAYTVYSVQLFQPTFCWLVPMPLISVWILQIMKDRKQAKQMGWEITNCGKKEEMKFKKVKWKLNIIWQRDAGDFLPFLNFWPKFLSQPNCLAVCFALLKELVEAIVEKKSRQRIALRFCILECFP